MLLDLSSFEERLIIWIINWTYELLHSNLWNSNSYGKFNCIMYLNFIRESFNEETITMIFYIYMHVNLKYIYI